jgi:hypothetical protein
MYAGRDAVMESKGRSRAILKYLNGGIQGGLEAEEVEEG